MGLFSRHRSTRTKYPLLLSAPRAAPAGSLAALTPPAPQPAPHELMLYDALRFSVPVIDAAVRKIVRLTGGFRLVCDSAAGQAALDRFSENVSVNASGQSIQLFADQMLDSLLTYGNAVGEMLIPDDGGAPQALVTAHPKHIRLIPDWPGHCLCGICDANGKLHLPEYPALILFAALDPPAGSMYGVSVLRGLPAVSRILLRIYDCIGQNYERAGNVRYAVTYRPDGDAAPYAREHAKEIAAAWSDGIRAAKYGEVQDFVAVGDIGIKVIGADNQLFDTNIPVRQLLEQIISKLAIPPFLLGFSWATTERMSTQQADILTSELEYFRRILTPVLRRIGSAALKGQGLDLDVQIVWDNINLQDETALAEARLKNAQAHEIELRNQQLEQGSSEG